MRRRPRLHGLQRQLLLWAGVAAVAFALLAMHQLSGGHTAANPAPVVAAHLDNNGHAAAEAGSFAAGHSATHWHGADQPPDPVAAMTGRGSPAPGDDGCPGCAEHHAMAVTCLATLTLLAVGFLLPGPVRWPGLVPRREARGLPPGRWRRWRPRSLSLQELAVSRT